MAAIARRSGAPAGSPAPLTAGAQSWRRPSARRVRAIAGRLRELYGIPCMAPHGDPLAELVLTVLSQSTNDRNRDIAYLRLRHQLPSWEAVRAAPVQEVEEAILDAIASTAPNLSLDWMRDAPVEESRAYLTALPGVGRKTAACVLLFSWGLREIPVDTHVSRVGARLALLRPGAGFQELHDQMLAITPAGRELELHVNLLRHGRRTCAARSPACGRCALARMCPSRRTGAAR